MAPSGKQQARWAHFEHVADVGVCGYGATLEQAFEQAALALTAIVTRAEIRPEQRVEVKCQQSDIELLLVDWLDAIIYEMSLRKMLFGRFAAKLEGHMLSGIMWGEPVDRARHAPACEPKGATLTGLAVRQEPRGEWSACCVVDV